MNAAIWIAAIVFGILTLLFGIASTWGILFFIITIILIALGIWMLYKNQKTKSRLEAETEK